MYTGKLKNIEDANKAFENLKSKADDYKIFQKDYDKKVREINKDFRSLQNDYTSYLKNLKHKDPMCNVLENYASTYNENHQYIDEVYTRKQILELYKLDDDKKSLQLFLLMMSYYNLGNFDNVRKTATLYNELYPTGSYAESVKSIVDFLPK
jgi:chromosome segregation ATPase